MVSQTSPITSLAELKGKRVGRINGYCTTSYFAAAIFLQRHGHSIKDFFAEIRDVGAWQKQIDAVVAGTVDATMVSADILASLPENATTTRVLGESRPITNPGGHCEDRCARNLRRRIEGTFAVGAPQ